MSSDRSPTMGLDGLAIYAVIETAAEVQGFGDLSHVGLPDSKPADDGDIRWAPGALEGVLGHHAGPDTSPAAPIADLVMAAADGGDAELRQLHDAAAEHESTASYVDEMINRLVELRPTVQALSDVARRLLHEGSARGAVKLGIALLGVTRTSDERDAILLVGRHDEFTLFAAVALSNIEASPDLTLWELAQHVTGWGRIHIVERLIDTTDPAIRSWLLREGFRNTVMNEYLAYIAATTGGLAQALAAPDVDDALFDAAGEIIEALISGGPARDIDDYEDSAQVLTAYVALAQARAHTLEHLRATLAIAEWLAEDDADWEPREQRGWSTALRDTLESSVRDVIERRTWVEIAIQALGSDDEAVRWTADNVLQRLGYSTFAYHLQALPARPLREHSWLVAAAQSPPESAELLITAARQLPLHEIASGPGASLGLGAEFVAHRCLDAVVRALHRLGVLPWDLIAASLSSPVLRSRHGALDAVRDSDRSLWPADATDRLREFRAGEPDARLREELDELLADQP